ncbi:MAG: hypothetical protein R2699_16500 [Acidimicrobiales bacterium]|nr:hypothetical protein [Acidimicrobiales bacterium]MCB1262519.1 hypothetical protein [Acidimicrobiales bacterium]
MAEATQADDVSGIDERHGGGTSMIVSFGPWIAVWVLTSNSSYIPGLLVATALAAGLLVFDRYEGRSTKLLNVGTLVVMAGVTIVGVVTDASWMDTWLSPILNGFLLLIMVASVAVGRPFTMEYAKESAPPEVWDTPAFRHINTMITWVWIAAVAAMFVGAIVVALLQSGDIVTDPQTQKSIESWANWGVTIVALVVAMKFTGWYPDAYKERQQRLHGQAA